MSARRVWDGGRFINGRDAANAADFMTRKASSFESEPKDPTQWRVVYRADIGEALSVVEDLWLRIARQAAVHSAVWSDTSTGERLLMFRFNGNAGDSECCQLLAAASSAESYRWRQDDSRGSLVNDLQWQGDVLVIELTPAHRMSRWPDGEAVNWQVQAVLNRMKKMGRSL